MSVCRAAGRERDVEPEPAQNAGDTGERFASSLAKCYKILSKELEVMVD